MAGDSMSGKVILPLLLDPAFKVDIDTLADWTVMNNWSITAVWIWFIPNTREDHCRKKRVCWSWTLTVF
jgi:hypothetical protein